jgi:putative hemolysin
VLEDVVGKIEDEHDEKSVRRVPEAEEVELDGATRIRDLEAEYGIEIPADAGFETLAGFLLFRLGEIPRAGESVEYQGRRYTVLEMDRNRIARVGRDSDAIQSRRRRERWCPWASSPSARWCSD